VPNERSGKRCGRTVDDEADGFLDWEAVGDGSEVVCEGCLTPAEQQAIDDQLADDEALWRLDPDTEPEDLETLQHEIE